MLSKDTQGAYLKVDFDSIGLEKILDLTVYLWLAWNALCRPILALNSEIYFVETKSEYL